MKKQLLILGEKPDFDARYVLANGKIARLVQVDYTCTIYPFRIIAEEDEYWLGFYGIDIFDGRWSIVSKLD